jgi:hypothetical protein
VNVLDFISDPRLAGPLFTPPETWTPWRAALRAASGLPLDAAQFALFRACTRRDLAPTKRAREFWPIVGRRGGKSRIAAAIGAWADAPVISKAGRTAAGSARTPGDLVSPGAVRASGRTRTLSKQ